MFVRGYESIPSNLDDLQPGPELGGVLGCIDVAQVSPHDRIVVLQAQVRQRSHYDAEAYRSMASVVDVMEEDKLQWAAEAAAAEIRAALRLTRRASDTELEFALGLRRRLPRVWEALATGSIDVRRAKLLWHRTVHLSVAAAREVIERVIEAAPRLTTGQLQARIDRVCIEADPDAAEDRYRYAVTQRRVVTEATDAGTAHLLGLDLPPHRVAAVTRRINQLAKGLKTKDEIRSMDQLRADIYLDLLAGNNHDGKTGAGGVHIHVDVDTLAALTEHPGELAGYGPVVADIARQVADQQQNTEWRWSVTDPETGELVHDGVTRRRPTAALRRHVQARDTTCVFPGCRMPAIDCDLDHQKRWADGGPTCAANLAPACRHDNIIKERAGWTCRRLPNGDHQWTSRLGHTYTTSGQPP